LSAARDTRYACLTILLVLALLGAGALFNYIINPFGLYDPPVIAGLNDRHPAAQRFPFLEKTAAVRRVQPDILVTGSSRADVCLDVKPAFFPGAAVYNFALPAASMHEQLGQLQYAQSIHPLRQAIVTLDFFAFDARKKNNPDWDFTDADVDNTDLLSIDTFTASFRQLKYMQAPDRYPYTAPNGTKIPNDFIYTASKAGAAWPFSRTRYADPVLNSATRQVGSRALKDFSDMLAFARAQKIDLILVILPVHDVYLKMQDDTHQTGLVEYWKKLLQERVRAEAEAANAAPYPFWDFSARSTFTADAVPKTGDLTAQMEWFWDPSHCKSSLGDIVLERVLALPEGDKYSNFGRRLM